MGVGVMVEPGTGGGRRGRGAHTTKQFGGAERSRNLGVDENLERLHEPVEKGVGGAHEGLDNLEPVIYTPAERARAEQLKEINRQDKHGILTLYWCPS